MAEPAATGVDELSLEVEGASVSGWKEVDVFRSIEAASGTFRLSTTLRQPVRVREGSRVTIRMAGRVIMLGHVDDLELETGPRASSMTLSGRDLTADLVDCSLILEPSEFAELPFAVLVNELAEPFGIEVRFEGSAARAKPFELFRVQPGETAWAAIERACRLRGFLAFPSGDGALVVARPGRTLAQAELILGRNVITAKLTRSQRARFQTYLVRGQSTGSDELYGEQVAEIEGGASDPGVSRFRPLLVLGDGPMTFEDARDRAQWEASVRAARAGTVLCDVQGWRQVPRKGSTWNLNELTRVLVPTFPLDQVLLVSSVRLVRDAEGNRSEIGLTRRNAYLPQPEVDQSDELELEED